ncbi:MAG: IMPACT family protein [Salibacteraceae bacterium]
MKSSFVYKSINENSESLFKDKGSKHFGFAYPVQSLDEIHNKVDFLRKEHGKANHVCYAYRLRSKGNLEEFSTDDGEPKNSAGPPILGQINSKELQNVLVAVVRYFGGTKLGVSGLINAYKTAAKMAIESSVIINKEDEIKYQLWFTYAVYNDVMRFVKENEINIVREENNESCFLEIGLKESSHQLLIGQLNKIEITSCTKLVL